MRTKTRADALEELDYIKSRFEKRLEEGDCFFLFSRGGELSFGKMKVCKDLSIIVKILRSKRSNNEKNALLECLSILFLLGFGCLFEYLFFSRR